MTIAGDNVDPVYIERPHRWDIHFIRRFMLIFGPLSSLFDLATFGVLIWVLKSGERAFHTAWFIESVLSASLVVFAVRTRLPIWKSRPSRAMRIMTALVCLAAAAIPYTPLAGLLGFEPLPVQTILILLGIVGVYLVSAEAVKRAFYRRVNSN
jgi:Mg2+-importing ATPase